MLKSDYHYMLEMIDIDIVRNTPDRERGENVHPHHELLLIRDGSYDVHVEGQDHSLLPGETIVFPAGLPHTPKLNADAQTHYYVLTWHSNFSANCPILFKHNNHRLQFIIPWLWQEHQQQSSRQTELLFELVINELTHLSNLQSGKQATQAKPYDNRIAMAESYIRQNYHRNVDINELAQLCHWSREHFIRQFKKHFQKTPNNYLQSIRVEAGISLLQSTQLSPQMICQQVGFHSISHLHKLIRRHTGSTINELRSRN